jgi:geranylgeranyl diphosphate synthase type II
MQSQYETKEPRNLYEPIHYIGSWRKKMRPVLTLMSAEVLMPIINTTAALAVEVFKFFISSWWYYGWCAIAKDTKRCMKKWNINTVLSGDAMLILAYQYFWTIWTAFFRDLAKLFSKTAAEVCEGQQWDVDFEEYRSYRPFWIFKKWFSIKQQF